MNVKDSLQRKMLYSFMTVIILVLVGVSIGISVLIRDYFMTSKQQELTNKGQELSRVILNYYEGRISLNQLTGFVDSVDHLLDSRVWVLEPSGQIVAMSTPCQVEGVKGHGPGPGWMGRKRMGSAGGNMNAPGGIRKIAGEIGPVFEGKIWTKVMEHPYYGENMVVVGVPIRGAEDGIKGAVLLNAPVTGINDIMWRIAYYIGITGLFAVVAAVFVVNRLAKGIVSPLKAMQEAAGAMAQGDYNAKVPIMTGDEVGQLGVALNSLAQDLARFVAQAERMEKIRRDFVANVSHELRTPITVIRGYSEAVLDGIVQSPGKLEEYHQQIREETIRLERLVKDLLDLSRLQSYEMPLEMEDIPVKDVIDSVVNMLQHKVSQKGLTLRAATEKPLPPVWGNGDRITQLLLILLDNAIKYTPDGGAVTVEAVVGAGQVIVTVSDSGIGIPEEDLPYIWERFYKVNKAHSRTEGGVGLGLAIAKEIMERHGASVTVQSELGKGTTFRVCFPAKAEQDNT